MGRSTARKQAEAQEKSSKFSTTLCKKRLYKKQKTFLSWQKLCVDLHLTFPSGNLAQFSCFRRPEQYTPRSINELRQKKDFLKHCFSQYPIPPHLFKGWGYLEGAATTGYEPWLVCVGRGGSLYRETNAKDYMTKREIHEFLSHSMDNWTISENIMRAKGRCAGIPDRVINIIKASNVFYSTQFTLPVIKNMLAFFFKWSDRIENAATVHDLSDYIRLQTPDLTGRTWDSLLRLSNEWHAQGDFSKKGAKFTEWTGSQLPNWTTIYKYANDNTFQGPEDHYELKWDVVQILNSTDLYEEGAAQRHCVAGYANLCKSGHSAIFSLRYSLNKNAGKNTKIYRALTLEVRGSRIVQARGRFNQFPTLRQKQILRKWAAENKLTYNTMY